jgi:hypothetical protein
MFRKFSLIVLVLLSFNFQSGFCAEEEKGASPFAKFVPQQQFPTSLYNPLDKFSVAMKELNGDSPTKETIRKTAILLLDRYADFKDAHFQEFLMAKSTISFLQESRELDESYRKLLLAIAYINGWGVSQEVISAVKLAKETTELRPAGLAWFLLGSFHQKAAHILRQTFKEHRNDYYGLMCWLQSKKSAFGPAILAVEEMYERSQLLISMPNPMPLTFSIQFHELPKRVDIYEGTSQLDRFALAAHLTQTQATNCYVHTAIATLGQQEKAATFTLGSKLSENFVISGYSCPRHLHNVLMHIIALKRSEQHSSSTGPNTSFVNLTTLTTDARAVQSHIPLETAPTLDSAKSLEADLKRIRMEFEGWYRIDSAASMEQFFKHISSRPTTVDRIQLVARLLRLTNRLHLNAEEEIREEVVKCLVTSDNVSHTLLCAELFCLKSNTPSSLLNFTLYLKLGLADAIMDMALRIAHREDHIKTPVEELYYWKLFQRFFLATPVDIPLLVTGDIPAVMRPLHAILSCPELFQTETYVQAAYKILHKAPYLVVPFLEANPDPKTKEAANKFAQEKGMGGESDEAKLHAFVLTENKKEVRKEVIPYILLHPHFKILSDKPDYD